MTTDRSARPATPSLAPEWLRGPWGVAAGLATVYVLAYVAWTAFQWGGEQNIKLISDIAYLPVSLFASAMAWRVGALRAADPRLRRAWVILGFAVFSQFIADFIWFYLEIVRQLPMDELFPSVADYFYLAFYPLMLWGLLTLPVAPLKTSDRLKFFLDLALVMVAAWMAVWYFLIVPTAEINNASIWTQILAAAYPIGDLVVMGGIVALLFRQPRDAVRSALLLFMAGLVFFVTADLLFGYTSLAGTYASGGWLDVGWIVAYLVFAYSGIRQAHLTPGPTSRWSESLVQRITAVLPFVAITLGYGLVLVISGLGLAPRAQVQGLIFGAALLTVSVVGRQLVAVRENQRLADELRAFSNELEKRVEQRTEQLQRSQEALLASQKLASVGTLAAGVVHEVSNPLNTIITASESLEAQLSGEPVDSETLKIYLPIISRAAWHATRIVQALRTYSRGSSPELAAQNLNEVVQDALLLMGYQLKSWRNVKLVTELEPETLEVICDRNQIAQVLINLLQNARDAMPNGGTVTLRTRHSEAGAVIEISDEGAGILPETLDKIFDPFFTTKAIGEGSGLGLSIVSGIMRAHNGAINVTSGGPGQGATFTVTLPITSAA